MFKYIGLIVLVMGLSKIVAAQKIISVSEAVNIAMANSKNLEASKLNIKKQQQLVRSSINIPNPDFFWESPTGKFYTGSITQSFEFPTVYARQKQLQKAQIGVAEKEKVLTEFEIKYLVRTLYVELQYADTLIRQLYAQDTLYNRIREAAIRQFNAGQITYLEQTFAEAQYGEVHYQYLQSITRVTAIQQQLQWLMGIRDSIIPGPISVYTFENLSVAQLPDSAWIYSNPGLQVLNQQKIVAQKNIQLQKNKALPGLAFGYFNQGERVALTRNRFRLGVTIPLWFWQYKGNINAAKTTQQVIENQQQGLMQQLSSQTLNARGEIFANWQSITYHQQTGLIKAKEVITTSWRFFESGEIDYVNFLRNTNDAFAIYFRYLAALRNYNLSVINYNYLTGTL
jgi:outer membrane protein TolC